MSILDERDEYLKNPYFSQHLYSNYSTFYIAVGVCSVLAAALFIFNIVCCWCSRHRKYWRSPKTGNRWVQPVWTELPHKIPPLDLSELDPKRIAQIQIKHEKIQYRDPESEEGSAQHPPEYLEMQKRESEI